MAPFGKTVFLSYNTNSGSSDVNKRGYMVSIDDGKSFNNFQSFDYSGGVAVDATGYFYLGIYVGNYTGTPAWTRQQFVVDLDLVAFDKTRGYGACEGTLCVSSSASAASDFSPITSTSFPCAQRGLSPNWCVS